MDSSGVVDPFYSLFCATLFLHSIGGDVWKRWKEVVLKAFADKQGSDGSWNYTQINRSLFYSQFGSNLSTALVVLSLSAGKQRLALFRPGEKE